MPAWPSCSSVLRLRVAAGGGKPASAFLSLSWLSLRSSRGARGSCCAVKLRDDMGGGIICICVVSTPVGGRYLVYKTAARRPRRPHGGTLRRASSPGWSSRAPGAKPCPTLGHDSRARTHIGGPPGGNCPWAHRSVHGAPPTVLEGPRTKQPYCAQPRVLNARPQRAPPRRRVWARAFSHKAGELP